LVPRFNEPHHTLLPIIIGPSSGFLPRIDYHSPPGHHSIRLLLFGVCGIDFPARYMSVSKLMAGQN